MGKLICHIVDKHKGDHLGIDQYIAEKLGWNPSMEAKGMSPRKVAALRGLFDQNADKNHTEPLISDAVVNPTVEQLEEAFKRLADFRKGTRARHAATIANSKKHIDRAYDALRHAFSFQERRARINFVSAIFSEKVDQLLQRTQGVDRQAVVNGFKTTSGEVYGGVTAIFNALYDDLLESRQQWYNNTINPQETWENIQNRIAAAKAANATHPEDRFLLDFKDAPRNAEELRVLSEKRFAGFTKLLESWNELLPFVMKDLVKKEGLKLNIKKEYVTTASVNDYGENELAEKWDASEAIRDGWHRNNDMESAFGSIGQQVRRILSTIYEVEAVPIWEEKNGRRVYKGIKTLSVRDDLGNRVFKDPIKVHQFLSEYLKGVQNSKDLEKRLVKPGTDEARIPWMQPLVDLLTGYGLPEGEKMRIGQIKTQLFVDFKKNFQPYSTMFEDEDLRMGPIKYIKTRVLNKAKNLLKSSYNISMSARGSHPVNVKVWGFTPVFEEGKKGGKVNWQRLAELRQEVLKWTHEEAPEQVGIFDKHKTYKTPTPALLTDNRVNTTININGKAERLTYDMKRNFLMEVFTSLGYDITVDAIDSILNSSDIYTVREQLEQLFNPDDQDTGIIYVLGGHKRDSLRKLTDPRATEEEKERALSDLNKVKDFKAFYNTTKGKDSKGKLICPVKEHSEKLLDIISNHQESKRVESRVRYQGNTMYSYVNPSFLGDRLEAIQSFVEKNDHHGLFDYLKEAYLEDPFFVSTEYISTKGETGKIYNMWLSELVEACNSKANLKDTVAAIFSYERDLGSSTKKFEDFTSKEHAQDMLIHFFADEKQHKGYGGKGSKNLNKKLTALYPVFILGDAGVSKYIRAPRISSAVAVDKDGRALYDGDDMSKKVGIEQRFDEAAKDKVLDHFYNVYLQEQRRMALDEAMGYDLYANGKPVKHPKGEFSFLTFLNPTSQEYISDYELPIDPETNKPTTDRAIVKSIIRKYLENATLNNLKRADNSIIPSFKQRLSDLGLLKTAKHNGKEYYEFLNSIIKPEEIDSKLTEFYWNTKLATTEQLQLMTIDPAFYASTKDLQKRYKEIHAPGNVLDVLARDFDGNLYSDGIERVVYFKDLKVNSEMSNPAFMATILRTFAKPGVDVEAAIAEGVLTPKADTAEETARKNKLIDILGNEMYKKVYEPYTGNTLTDGQGYRTLTSYRKVMGMAGKWTQGMENMYNYIMTIREEYTNKGKDIPEQCLKQIADFALVLQPIKPYMFTHEKVPVPIQKTDDKGNKLVDKEGKPIYITVNRHIPVQHKYAEALIIPELMPQGSKLRDLGLWMDNNNVDLVGSDKINKVGCFGQADLSKVQNSMDLITAMETGKKHELSYKDYRIQTNVPEHINASQLFGTQVRKLIMANLNRDDYSFYLDGQTVNLSNDGGKTNTSASLKGKNLLALYNSLICANIFDSYDKFAQNAEDIETVSELLQQSTVGSMRESMDNLFSYVVTGNEEKFKEFMIPLFEGGLEHDAAALLLSTFKRIVNKQQISGGSAVQVSAFGINGYSEDGNLRFVTDNDNKNNILYAEIEMPFDKSMIIDVKNADGSTSKQSVSLDYSQYCYEDGNLRATGKALEKGTKEWKKYQSYTYKEVDGKLVPCSYNDSEAKVYKPLIEEDYPDILSILAYRIPSENDYSMINCRIKRFTSKAAGGTIKVPAEGTTIAGFDFDIDKLYFMQREYHKHRSSSSYVESKYSDEDKDHIWAAIYKDDIRLERALRDARAEAEANDSNGKLTKTITLKSGRSFKRSLTTLNSYYDKVDGKSITGKTKEELFAEKAQQMGIEPTQNLTKEDEAELETYDFTKTPEDNTRASRNNLLISLIQARLMDPETMKQRYTPGGFEDAKNTARFLRELRFGKLAGVLDGRKVNLKKLRERRDPDTDPEPNYSATDPYTILVYNQQNQVAGKLIGIFANQNTHNAFVSCLDKFELSEEYAIDFCGHHNMRDLLHKNSPEMAAKVSLNVAQFLSASVDAVKDPVLNFMNLNTITADSAALLARLGYSMDEIGLFLSQPVIVDICQEAFNSEMNIQSVISNMTNKLDGYLTGIDTNNTDISENDLALCIINDRLAREQGKNHEDFLKENAKMQKAVLEIFSKVLKASQDVSDFVTNTKFTASNAVSSTFGGLYAQQLRVTNYLNRFEKGSDNSISYSIEVSSTAEGAGVMHTPISNKESMIEMSKEEYLHEVRFNPFAYEQAMYDTNRKALKLFAKYFPYETTPYKGARNKLNDICMRGSLGEDEINSIHSALPVAILAKQTASDFYGEGLHYVRVNGEYKKSNVTNRTYYREDFAGDLVETLGKYPELMDVAIFKYMLPESKDVSIGKDPETGNDIVKETWAISMQDVGGLGAEAKEEIKESWDYLMEVDDEGNFKNLEYADLGKDLFMYCFYQMGFDFSPISFMHLAPTAVKDNIKVERKSSLPLKSFKAGDIKWDNPKSNDVIVWSRNKSGSTSRNAIEFESNVSETNNLRDKAYELPEEMTHWRVKELVKTAISRPELRFKIDRKLTQEEFNLFSKASLGMDVPANIYFSQETLDEVSQESKEAISYGKSRTYREFLAEIKQDKFSDFDTEDFAKQWILNHLDNAKFVFDIQKSSKKVREELITQAEREVSIHSDRITIDISKFLNNNEKDSRAFSAFVKVKQEGKIIISSTWCPVILYNGSFYMAESNSNMGFNINKNVQMTYVKVSPMGTTKSYKYDGIKEINPSMKYQSYYGEKAESRENAEVNIPGRTYSVDNSEEDSDSSDEKADNRDSSTVEEALNTIKTFAGEKSLDTELNWEDTLTKLLELDLKEQVKEENDPINDTTYDAVDEIMKSSKAWKRGGLAQEQKNNLVSAIFEYNKNPKYLTPPSPVSEDPLVGGNGTSGLSPAIRQSYENIIIAEYSNAVDSAGVPISNTTAQKIAESFKESSDAEISTLVNMCLNACRKDGCMILDKNGLPTKAC